MSIPPLWKRLTPTVWLVCGVVLVAIVLGGWLTHRQYALLTETLRIKHQGLDEWDLAQLQRELLQFEAVLERFDPRLGEVDAEALRLHWDLVWSRMNVVNSGETGRALRRLPPSVNKLPRVQVLLDEVDAQFPRLLTEPAAVRPGIQQRLERAVELSQETYALVYNEAVQNQVALRRTLQTIQLLTIALGGLLVVLVLLLIGLLWRSFSGEVSRLHGLMAELRSSEDRFRALVEGSIQGLLVHRDGRLLFVNHSLAHIFGYDSPEAVLQAGNVHVLNAPEERRRLEGYNRARLAGQSAPERYEYQGIKRDGTRIWVEAFARVVTWEGEPAVQSTLVDITERKRAEEALRNNQALLQSVIDTLPYWITVKDTDLRYRLVNTAMARAIGLRVEEFAGRETDDVSTVPASVRADVVELDRRVLETGERAEQPRCELTLPNGENQVRRRVHFPLRGPDGAIVGVIGWSEDITDRDRHLEAMAQARESAERANRLKDKFVSLIAHDLRAPLGNLKLLLEMLDHEDADPGERRDLKRVLNEKCDTMVGMIDELLKISRLQSGELQPERRFVSTGQLTSALLELRPYAERKGVALVNEVPEDVRLYVDPNLMREVVQNLVHNAIKFSRRGDSVALKMPSRHPPTLAVADTGVGLREELAENLFKYEVKTSSAGTEGEQGTGLGLPLCNDILLAHDGRLQVSTHAGGGTTFTMELPDVQPRVLVVDPDQADRELIAAGLAEAGYGVEAAGGLPAARSVLEAGRAHLLVCDLPRLHEDGQRLLDVLHTDLRFHYLPVVALTAEPDEALREHLFRAGVDDVLAKPVSLEVLLPRVRRFLG